MNIPPNTGATPAEIKKRNQAATRFLKRNDPLARKEKKRAKRQKQKDREQAKKNPALVAEYRRAMLKTR